MTITDPRKRRKKSQNRSKKDPKQNLCVARSSRHNDLTFDEKNFPLHNPFNWLEKELAVPGRQEGFVLYLHVQ